MLARARHYTLHRTVYQKVCTINTDEYFQERVQLSVIWFGPNMSGQVPR